MNFEDIRKARQAAADMAGKRKKAKKSGATDSEKLDLIISQQDYLITLLEG